MMPDPITLPGQAAVPVTPREPTILDARDLAKLGTALGRSFFAYGADELRADSVAPELTDNLPAGVVLIRTRRQHAETLTDVPGEHPWSPSTRERVPAWTEDVYHRASVVPAGSFERARPKEAGDRARLAKRSDPERQAAAKQRAQLSAARHRWLAGENVSDEELGR